jgi:hypothetical protein
VTAHSFHPGKAEASRNPRRSVSIPIYEYAAGLLWVDAGLEGLSKRITRTSLGAAKIEARGPVAQIAIAQENEAFPSRVRRCDFISWN